MLIKSYPTIITGTVTQANMRISAVNGGATASGGAFIDFSNSVNPLRNYLGDEIEIFDSSLRSIKGWLKGYSSAETLSPTEVNPDPGFDTTVGWNITGNWSITGGKAIVNSASSLLYQLPPDIKQPVASLVKTTFDVDSTNGIVLVLYGTSNENSPAISGTGEKVNYHTMVAPRYVGFYSNLVIGQYDNLSRTQVLTPSPTGATITSLRDGSLYNFSTKHASFNYNDTAGYTYKISSRLRVA
jgi:hypothetical protein